MTDQPVTRAVRYLLDAVHLLYRNDTFCGDEGVEDALTKCHEALEAHRLAAAPDGGEAKGAGSSPADDQFRADVQALWEFASGLYWSVEADCLLVKKSALANVALETIDARDRVKAWLDAPTDPGNGDAVRALREVMADLRTEFSLQKQHAPAGAPFVDICIGIVERHIKARLEAEGRQP